MSLFRGMFLSGHMGCWTSKMKLVSLIELIGLVSSKNEIPNKVGMYIYIYVILKQYYGCVKHIILDISCYSLMLA